MYDYDYFEFDSDGDGYADSIMELYDSTGDGQYDIVQVYSDTTGDGNFDTFAEACDSDHNGVIDTIVSHRDTTGDGMVDLVQKAHDYNQDGEIDSVTTYVDSDSDGKYERVGKAYDSNRDGKIDTMDIYEDLNGSGQPDFHEVYAYDPSTGSLTPAIAGNYDLAGTMYYELDNFQPNEDYPDGISGDPQESMNHWECQGDTNRCALYSQKFVIEELSGSEEKIDIEEFTQVAKDNGWFTEEEGTTFLNMNHMLDYYGIDNEMSFHNTIDDIEACLNDGGKVIVSLDSNEIWHGQDNNIFVPSNSSNHAVEVIGIDRTDPNHVMVILNDSGTPYGRGEMVPLEVFEGAWEDGDCQMIECYPANNKMFG